MSIAKKFSLSVAAALAAVVLSVPSFADDMHATMHQDVASYDVGGGGGSGSDTPNVWLALYTIFASIL